MAFSCTKSWLAKCTAVETYHTMAGLTGRNIILAENWLQTTTKRKFGWPKLHILLEEKHVPCLESNQIHEGWPGEASFLQREATLWLHLAA